MKIVYYGNFASHASEEYIAQALERQGVEVVRMQRNKYSLNDVHQATKDADYLLYPKTKGYIKSYCPQVCWLFDLYFNLPNTFNRDASKAPMFRADYVFTSDGGNEENWEKLKINHQTLRQGVDKDGKYMVEPDYKYDVAFVGGLTYEYRSKLVTFLKKHYKFKIVQDQFAHNLNHELSKVKIVVGDSVPSPKYWSNRVYEITGRGGFLIHPHVEGLRDEFPDMVQFEHGNFDELKEKIDYYLVHDDERESIKNKCHDICPTYDDRVKELLCQLS